MFLRPFCWTDWLWTFGNLSSRSQKSMNFYKKSWVAPENGYVKISVTVMIFFVFIETLEVFRNSGRPCVCFRMWNHKMKRKNRTMILEGFEPTSLRIGLLQLQRKLTQHSQLQFQYFEFLLLVPRRVKEKTPKSQTHALLLSYQIFFHQTLEIGLDEAVFDEMITNLQICKLEVTVSFYL